MPALTDTLAGGAERAPDTARMAIEAVSSLTSAAQHLCALVESMNGHTTLYGRQEIQCARRTLLYLSDTAAMILDRDLLPELTGHNAPILRSELERVRTTTLNVLTGVKC